MVKNNTMDNIKDRTFAKNRECGILIPPLCEKYVAELKLRTPNHIRSCYLRKSSKSKNQFGFKVCDSYSNTSANSFSASPETTPLRSSRSP